MTESASSLCYICKSKANCFQSLTGTELRLTNKHKARVPYREKELVCKQGSQVSQLMYLKKGYVKVIRETLQGEMLLDIIPQGKLLGLSALYADNVSQYNLVTLTKAIVCTIDIEIIEQLIKQNGNFASEVIATLNKQTNMVYRKMGSITQKQLNGRLADALLYFSEQIFCSAKFPLLLTRKELGSFCGMSSMSMIRSLNLFKRDKIITIQNTEVEILNKPALIHISRSG